MRTRVKICGITRVEDAQAAVDAGTDALGLVFDPHSPRYVTLEQARMVANVVPPFVALVGLFVDADSARVRETLQGVRLNLLQFHGDEIPEHCRSYGRPYIKAIRMRTDVDLAGEARRYGDASGLLLDSYVTDRAGGSGEAFDWRRVPSGLARPIILAGGLTADNVGAAIRQLRPSAVDVSSGVEAAKGIKDHAKVAAFIAAARSAL